MGRCHRDERTSLSLLLTGFVYTVVSKYCVHGLAKKKKSTVCMHKHAHTLVMFTHMGCLCLCPARSSTFSNGIIFLKSPFISEKIPQLCEML